MRNKWLEVRPEDKTAFEQTFRLRLKEYFDGIYGFDMTKFIDDIGVPDDASAIDFVRTKYGDESISLIKRIINI